MINNISPLEYINKIINRYYPVNYSHPNWDDVCRLCHNKACQDCYYQNRDESNNKKYKF